MVRLCSKAKTAALSPCSARSRAYDREFDFHGGNVVGVDVKSVSTKTSREVPSKVKKRVTEEAGLSGAFGSAGVHAIFAPHTAADRVLNDGGQTEISCMKAGWPVADYDRGV